MQDAVVLNVAKSLTPLQRFCRSDFARHGLLVFAASMLVNVFNYVFHVIVSRLLGVDEYGALSSIISGLTLLTIPATIATVVVAKYAAEFASVGDRERLTSLTHSVLRFGSIGGVLGGLCIICVHTWAGVFLHIANSQALIATALAAGCALFLPVARGILQGVQDFKAFAISNLLEGGCKVLAGTVLVAAGFGLTGAIAGFIAGSVLSLLYTVVVVRRHAGPAQTGFTINPGRLFHTTLGAALSIISITMLGFADMLLVKHFFSPEIAGYYGAVSLAGKMLYFVVGFAPTIVLPKATALTMRDESPRPIFIQAALVTMGISFAALAAFAIAPVFILTTLAGHAFTPAATYLFPYGIAMTLLAATNLCANYRIAMHRFEFTIPLAAVTVIEILLISMFHATIYQVIADVAIGNLAALLVVVSPFSLRAPVAAQISMIEHERVA